MSHDPQARAAAYVVDEMPPAERAAFEHHLLTCGECRSEVDSGRYGQILVERTRATAPALLEARVVAALTDRQGHGRRRRARLGLAVACGLVILAAAGRLAANHVADRPGIDPVVAAVEAYREDRMPVSGASDRSAPDLSGFLLAPTSEAGGELGGQPVSAYVYRGPAGRRLAVYVSEEPFPRPADAEQPSGPGGSWVVARQSVTVVCAPAPHEMLVVGDDPDLVEGVARSLDVA